MVLNEAMHTKRYPMWLQKAMKRKEEAEKFWMMQYNHQTNVTENSVSNSNQNCEEIKGKNSHAHVTPETLHIPPKPTNLHLLLKDKHSIKVSGKLLLTEQHC